MKQIVAISLLIFLALTSKAQLIINELSQGPSGFKEYVELLVTGTPVCGGANTVDLRGWIIDDNNSWHESGTGSGIAAGHVRFANINQWASVKIGTLILIYNDADTSPATAGLSIDSSDTNNDCVYIIPVSSSLLEKNTTLPASNGTMTTYNVGGTVYSSTGTWIVLGMANGGDAFHTVSPANYAAPYHAIGWGNVSSQLNIYFTASQSGMVIYMANTVDSNPFNQLNFIDTTASTHETPGAPNNAANAAWISSLNNNCQPFVPPVVNIGTPLLLTCTNTSVILTATSSGSIFEWSNGTEGPTDTVSSPGTYQLTVTDAAGVCSATASVVVAQNITPPNVSIATPDSIGCGSASDTLFASSTTTGVTYDWGGGVTTAEHVISLAGNYSVTVSDPSNGCAAAASVTVHSTANLNLSISSTNTTCGNSNGSAAVTIVSGNAQGYVWSNFANTASISNLPPGSYSVTVDGGAGCSAVANTTVGASTAVSVTVSSNKSIMCSSDSALICAGAGYATYIWNTGDTSTCIKVKQAGNYYVTVSDISNCTAASNHVALNVYPLPPVSISVNGDTLTAYNAVTYQWLLNGTAITNATSNIYIAQQSGAYTVEVTDSNGCYATSTAVNIVTGINDLTEGDNVNVFPNPVTVGGWKLIVASNLIGCRAEVVDATGRIVFQSAICSPQSEIDFPLPSGIYWLRVVSGHRTFTKKLIRL